MSTHILIYNFQLCEKAEIFDLTVCIIVKKGEKNSKSRLDLDLDRTVPNVKIF